MFKSQPKTIRHKKKLENVAQSKKQNKAPEIYPKETQIP